MAAFFNENGFLIAQCFGFAAMATAITMYQFKKHRTIMLLMVLCSGLWCLHFACLGKFTGVLMNVVNVARALVYTQREKKWASGPCIPAFFVLAALVCTYFTWEDRWSLLPCAASVCATLGSWQTDVQKLRLYTVGVCTGWFVYNLVNRSWAGMANEIFTLVSVVVALWRYRFRPADAERKERRA